MFKLTSKYQVVLGVGWLVLALGLLKFVYWLDLFVFDLFKFGYFFDQGVVFFTEYFFWFGLGGLCLFVLGKLASNKVDLKRFLPFLFAVVLSSGFVFVLKKIFKVDRPYLALGFKPLVVSSLFSFPSGHATLAFSTLLPLRKIFKNILWWGVPLASLIAVARVYQGVHYPSDILVGASLGLVVGYLLSHSRSAVLLEKLWLKLEFRRQFFHFLAGLLVVSFGYYFTFSPLVWLICLGFSLGLVWLSTKVEVPLVSDFLLLFQRSEGFKTSSASSLSYFLMGTMLALIIFPKDLALAAILIFAVGDSINHLVIKTNLSFPWNKRKNLIGYLIAVMAAGLSALFFVAWPVSFIVSGIVLLVETVDWRIGNFYLDDNLYLPLLTSLLLVSF